MSIAPFKVEPPIAGLTARLRWSSLVSGAVALVVGGLPDAALSVETGSAGPIVAGSMMELQLAQSSNPEVPAGPPVSRERNPALDQVLAANSSAALIMFLIAHPDDFFAEQARVYLRARPAADSDAILQAVAGPQAPAVAAFDAARLQGTAAAWEAFMVSYGQHPLAREVEHFR